MATNPMALSKLRSDREETEVDNKRMLETIIVEILCILHERRPPTRAQIWRNRVGVGLVMQSEATQPKRAADWAAKRTALSALEMPPMVGKADFSLAGFRGPCTRRE